MFTLSLSVLPVKVRGLLSSILPEVSGYHRALTRHLWSSLKRSPLAPVPPPALAALDPDPLLCPLPFSAAPHTSPACDIPQQAISHLLPRPLSNLVHLVIFQVVKLVLILNGTMRSGHPREAVSEVTGADKPG